MAETKEKTPELAPTLAREDGWSREPKARFEIRPPNPGFAGERFEVKFHDGSGWTDDPIKAHAMLEIGYRYFDYKSQKLHEPKQEEPQDASADDGVEKK